jgi:hypothetical protein
MVTIERLLLFLLAEGRPSNAPKAVRDATKAALRDLKSLEEDASFKAQKVQLLLDATLGRINLAQNDVIKLFSVLAVIFMPPTVIASIYGMNFKEMPELEWHWGYPLAIILMVLGCTCSSVGRSGYKTQLMILQSLNRFGCVQSLSLFRDRCSSIAAQRHAADPAVPMIALGYDWSWHLAAEPAPPH